MKTGYHRLQYHPPCHREPSLLHQNDMQSNSADPYMYPNKYYGHFHIDSIKYQYTLHLLTKDHLYSDSYITEHRWPRKHQFRFHMLPQSPYRSVHGQQSQSLIRHRLPEHWHCVSLFPNWFGNHQLHSVKAYRCHRYYRSEFFLLRADSGCHQSCQPPSKQVHSARQPAEA